jgi:probable phosphoglycerate mutase
VRLLLIRHGQTPSNVSGAIDTAYPGADLTELGVAQARAVPGALAAEDLSAIYRSDRLRTQLTAAPLAEARSLDVEVMEGLEEISAGDLEMRADTASVQTYAACVLDWMRGDLDRRIPGGTTGHEFIARYDAGLRSVAKEHDPADTVVVFSHGAAIRAYTAWATGMDPRAAEELRIMNTGLSLLEGDPDTGWRLTRWSTEPLGGLELEDRAAQDVTGEAAAETR